jgi:dihydroxyacid dehydratase/phosphogluconate dehydratase
VGGPLALVRTGDMIELDVARGRLHLDVADDVLAARRAEWSPPRHQGVDRGYKRLYFEQVLQAELGCDFDFLRKSPTRRDPL